MKKIVTAINNPALNEKLISEDDIELIGKDIQYKEAILEILEKNDDIDILILSESLPGEIDTIELVKIIKKRKIKLIFIIERENGKLEENLNEEHIDLILYNNKITINDIVQVIKREDLSREDNIKKEIEFLKEIVLKNEQKYKIKRVNINIKNTIKNLLKKPSKTEEKSQKKSQKIITFFGDDNVGKTTIISTFIKILLKKHQKILLINFNEKNDDIFLIFEYKNNYHKNVKSNQIIESNYDKNLKLFDGKNLVQNEKFDEESFKKLITKQEKVFIETSIHNNKKLNEKILEVSNKIIFLSQTNLIDISKSRKILQEFFNNNFIKKEKINIIFNKYNKYSIDENILKNIFSEFNIIGKINNNLKYNKLINNNLEFIVKKIVKENEKILNKIIN